MLIAIVMPQRKRAKNRILRVISDLKTNDFRQRLNLIGYLPKFIWLREIRMTSDHLKYVFCPENHRRLPVTAQVFLKPFQLLLKSFFIKSQVIRKKHF